MVAKQNDTEISHLQIQSNSPMLTTMAPNSICPRAQTANGKTTHPHHHRTRPAPTTGDWRQPNHHGLDLKAKNSTPMRPNSPSTSTTWRLRFLDDLDHDNTQIEPTRGDGVAPIWARRSLRRRQHPRRRLLLGRLRPRTRLVRRRRHSSKRRRSLRRRIRTPIGAAAIAGFGWRKTTDLDLSGKTRLFSPEKASVFAKLPAFRAKFQEQTGGSGMARRPFMVLFLLLFLASCTQANLEALENATVALRLRRRLHRGVLLRNPFGPGAMPGRERSRRPGPRVGVGQHHPRSGHGGNRAHRHV